jgi:uncharacterized protein (DUF488 family)
MIYTVGHSTRTENEFIDLLRQYSIETLVDVRTLPHSRWNPHFNAASLRKSLPASKINYVHEPELGGLRKPVASSINTAWKNPGFRGYADYMQTEQFNTALTRIVQLSTEKKIALMCAEAYFGKCHRMLLSDALIVRGVQVIHILDLTQTKPHQVTSFAKVNGTKITYPADQSQLEF